VLSTVLFATDARSTVNKYQVTIHADICSDVQNNVRIFWTTR
jgi:hypothetical protein